MTNKDQGSQVELPHEEKLRRIQMMMERTERIAQTGSWEWDAEADIVTWSNETYRFFGRDPADGIPNLAGQKELYTPEDTQRLFETVAKALADGQPYDIELCGIRPNGEKRYCHILGFPERNASGKIVRLAGSLQDITERKNAEKALREANENLERRVTERTQELVEARNLAEAANVAKSAFLANMSHEIRTPLNAISGMCFLVQRSGVTPQQAQYLEHANAASKHLLQIISDILDISRIEAGKFVFHEEPVDVRAIAENVIAMLLSEAQAKHLQLTVDIRDLPRGLVGDATRIRQALLNYASNAIKFSDNGLIAVRAQIESEDEQGVLLRFEVEDHGIGIPEQAIDRLFVPFEQVDNSMTRQYGGTGLGLAITRRLAELMGGCAGVSSEVGQGSTFWFTARLKHGIANPISAKPVSGDSNLEGRLQAALQGWRVLIVEDDPINQNVVKLLFETVGLAYDLADNGAVAVAKAAQTDYALILMDMQMPIMGGLEATHRIRQLPRGMDVPIVAMTANAFADDRDRCLSAGMNDFIAKPCEPAKLFQIMLKCLSCEPV